MHNAYLDCRISSILLQETGNALRKVLGFPDGVMYARGIGNFVFGGAISRLELIVNSANSDLTSLKLGYLFDKSFAIGASIS